MAANLVTGVNAAGSAGDGGGQAGHEVFPRHEVLPVEPASLFFIFSPSRRPRFREIPPFVLLEDNA